MPLFRLGGTYNGHNEDPPFGCIELHFEVPYQVSCVICSCHDLVFRPNENTIARCCCYPSVTCSISPSLMTLLFSNDCCLWNAHASLTLGM